jgi:antitoxin VapB
MRQTVLTSRIAAGWQNVRMGISTRNEQTEKLARELARETGESLTTAIRRALEERLERGEGRRSPRDKLRLARAALQRVDALPVLDGRSPEEILGYGEHGLP